MNTVLPPKTHQPTHEHYLLSPIVLGFVTFGAYLLHLRGYLFYSSSYLETDPDLVFQLIQIVTPYTATAVFGLSLLCIRHIKTFRLKDHLLAAALIPLLFLAHQWVGREMGYSVSLFIAFLLSISLRHTAYACIAAASLYPIWSYKNPAAHLFFDAYGVDVAYILPAALNVLLVAGLVLIKRFSVIKIAEFIFINLSLSLLLLLPQYSDFLDKNFRPYTEVIREPYCSGIPDL